MNVTLLAITLILYATSSVLFFLVLFKGRRPLRAAERVLEAGFVVHCLSIGVRFLEAGHFPLTNLHESLSVFACSLVGFYIYLQRRHRLEALGSSVSVLALLMTAAAYLSPSDIGPLPPILRSYWLPVHSLLCFLGDGAFALAFCAGVLYLLQERMIKSKSFGRLSRMLPSLQVLDEVNYRALTVGFPLLTAGIITGAIWANYAWGSYWSWDPKETWSLITWLLYAALLHQRLTVGWRGRRAAVMAMVGFGAVLFTFLGVNLLIGGLHAYS